ERAVIVIIAIQALVHLNSNLEFRINTRGGKGQVIADCRFLFADWFQSRSSETGSFSVGSGKFVDRLCAEKSSTKPHKVTPSTVDQIAIARCIARLFYPNFSDCR